MTRIALPFAAALAVSLAACTPSTGPTEETASPSPESTTASPSATTTDQGMSPTEPAQPSNPNLPAHATTTTDPDMRSTTQMKQDPNPPTTPTGISERAPPPIEDPAPVPPPTQ
ncbi:MAG: hypothetical protein LH470_01080 [Lysobacter sp.]|nr:hypothetical protein [Lysobacter sp.]